MERRYSKQLTQKAKRIFEKRSGRQLSDDEVEMCMDKICQVVLLYGKVMSRKIKSQNHESKDCAH